MGDSSEKVAEAGERARLPLVALVGRANVGKSTLFNRLARESRSLVEDRPGVTRDRVMAEARIEGRDVLLVDTGGLDPEAEEGIPAAVRAQVQQVVEEADVVLFVVDGRTGLLPLDEHIADVLRRGSASIVVTVNKSDGPMQDAAANEFHALGFPDLVAVSAEHRRGIVDLEITIAEQLPEEVTPFASDDDAVRVAIVGRPNVGKSSLLNRLIGEDQAIVADEPGTTRDSTDTRLRMGTRDVVLIDTAGLRRAGKRKDRLERGSAFMALRSIERAHVAMLVIDVIEGVTDQDAKVARVALDRGRPVVLVCNKWDAVEPSKRRPEIARHLERKLGFVRDPLVRDVSAKTGRGTGRLLADAIRLYDSGKRVAPTARVNQVLQDAVAGYAPPASGKRRPRLYYATQVGDRPFTIIIFVNDPSLIPTNYRRYLESCFRKAYNIRSAPVRVVLRGKKGRDGEEEIDTGGGPRRR